MLSQQRLDTTEATSDVIEEYCEAVEELQQRPEQTTWMCDTSARERSDVQHWKGRHERSNAQGAWISASER